MKMRFIFPLILLLSGCSNISVLDPRSATGKEQANLIWFSLAIMMVVLVVVFILFIRFVTKYRYRKDHPDFMPEDVHGSVILEITWTVIPIILLIILAVPTVKTTLGQSPRAEMEESIDGVHIDVTAEQFSWTFEHENGKTIRDEFVIPEGEKIILHLTSIDVIHSFWVPKLAGKIDLIPHEEIIYVIEDAEIGTYPGKCAEYCGIQHTNMVFDAKVVSKEDYEKYLEKTASEADE